MCSGHSDIHAWVLVIYLKESALAPYTMVHLVELEDDSKAKMTTTNA